MRNSIAAILTAIGSLVGGSVTAQECLQGPIMSTAGEKAMSPFGVDRTGRTNTGGVHLGLDIINDAGRGDPILAGLPGRILLARIDGTNSVFLEVEGGRQQLGYLHGDTIQVSAGDVVAADDQVITQGAKGAGPAVHLHLYVALRGDVVASFAEAAGAAWPQARSDGYWGNKRATPLLGAAMRDAAPTTFYMVNPETFLHHRIPWNPGILTVELYKRQGFIREDGMTLPPTCAPSATTFERGGFASTNGGATSDATFANGGAGGNLQVNANLASSDARDAVLERAEYSIAALQVRHQRRASDAYLAAGWAGLALAVGENNH